MDCMRDSFRKGVVLNGRYETISYVHEGSFGMVFKALDLETGEIVAVKCLTKRSVVDEAHAEFAAEDCLEDSEELAIHKHLGSHPNIVNLLTSFESESHLYFVLEYCERGDLYEAIRAGQGPVDTEDVRKLVLEVIDAVQYIHSKGIYHRDIKPENIFLTDDGRVKLGDFGLATSETWSYENAVGSDRYMAPEQCESAGAGYSPAKADVWSIGICLLNILFSKNPFSQPTVEDPFFRDFFADNRSLFDIFDTMSEDTFEVLEHCLNLNPARRSLSRMRRALLNVESFATSCEDVDAFLVGSPKAQATANREPLGTPAIQSPTFDQCGWADSTFWTRSLQATPPQPIRSSNLKMVDDVGSYSEDLFANSMESSNWCSTNTNQSHSLASTVESNAASSRSFGFNLALPEKHRNKFTTGESAVAGSLPISMTKPKPIRSLDAVFGRRDDGPKSWSEMFDEDLEEETGMEMDVALQTLRGNNARTFSHESKVDEAPARASDSHTDVHEGSADSHDATPVAASTESKEDVDGLFMYEPPSPKRETPPPVQAQWPRYSPPSKKSTSSTLDKWSALGERRRAFAESAEKEQSQKSVTKQTPIATSISTSTNNACSGTQELNRPRRNFGFANNYYGWGSGNVEHHSSTYHVNAYNFNRNRDHRSGQSKEGHGCPWTRRYDLGGLHRDAGLRGDCRDWNWRKENRQDFGKLGWVGGILEARS